MSFEGYKVVTAREMARIESLSIREGASAKDYMMVAGEKIALRIRDFARENNLEKKATLLVGKGNNGGDAFVAGAYLLRQGFSVVAYQLFPNEMCRPLCREQSHFFLRAGGNIIFPSSHEEISCEGVIVDGLLGTGFEGCLEGLLLAVVKQVNQSQLPIIAIDIPSGVNGNTGEVKSQAIRASETIFLGLPKMGFFLSDGYNHIGNLSSVDFGIDEKYLYQAKAIAWMPEERSFSSFLPLLVRTRHKYQAGYILAIGGSPGMSGSVILSCLAALRMGGGIVRLFHQMGMEGEFAHAPYEIIRSAYQKSPKEILTEMHRAASMLIGPGLGRAKEREVFLKSFIEKVSLPTVIDADGLFHLKDAFARFKFPAVLTPHHGEMLSLLGKTAFDDLLAQCQQFVESNDLTLVLKGAPTFVFQREKIPLVIPRGDPGMATAGTGDVLTGMIAALLAQKLSPFEAGALAVYIHARAGECIAEKKTSYPLIASDLFEAFPQVFKELCQLT